MEVRIRRDEETNSTESSKDNTSNGSNSHSTSSSSPVALSFNAYGERLAS